MLPMHTTTRVPNILLSGHFLARGTELIVGSLDTQQM
jgi:hypothetical protein